MQTAKHRRTEKVKEELRKMTQHEDNKSCLICGMRGPIYAVLDFQSFVCSTCSAIHRSMQHKVKGISMSEFTDEELAGLRVGGNARAAKIWQDGYRNNRNVQGDEAATRAVIRDCFVEKRFFNVNEFNRLQDDIATAMLPPVKVLSSLDSIGPLQTSTMAQPQPAHTASSSTSSSTGVTQPSGPVQRPAGASDGIDFFGEMQTSHAQPQVSARQPAAQQATDDFDSFFGARTAPQPQQSQLPLGTQSSKSAVHDLFGVPAPQATQPSTDFFSPSAAHSSVAPSNFFKEPVWTTSDATRATHQQQAPPPSVAPHSSGVPELDAFASLDPFGAKKR